MKSPSPTKVEQDQRYNTQSLIEYMMNGISTYFKRRQQIIMRLGKDIGDKKSIQDFNQHYQTAEPGNAHVQHHPSPIGDM